MKHELVCGLRTALEISELNGLHRSQTPQDNRLCTAGFYAKRILTVLLTYNDDW